MKTFMAPISPCVAASKIVAMALYRRTPRGTLSPTSGDEAFGRLSGISVASNSCQAPRQALATAAAITSARSHSRYTEEWPGTRASEDG